VAWAGPEIGEHTDEVLRELAGMSPEEIARLRREGVV
jgi:formyl-CoA transferase